MERETEFRGLTEDNEWVYGDLIHCKGEVFIKNEDDFELSHYGFRGSFRYVLPETVGQYTGLKDKNRVKIYEGDILHGNASFGMGRDFLVNSLVSFSIGIFNLGRISLCTLHDKVEIVGNIHQNPELLTK